MQGKTIQQLVDEHGFGILIRCEDYVDDETFRVDSFEDGKFVGFYSNDGGLDGLSGKSKTWFLAAPSLSGPEWRTLDELLKGQAFPVRVSGKGWGANYWAEIVADKRSGGYPAFTIEGKLEELFDSTMKVWKLWTPPPKKDRWVAFFIDDASDYNHHKISVIRERDLDQLHTHGIKVVRCPWLDPSPEWSPDGSGLINAQSVNIGV